MLSLSHTEVFYQSSQDLSQLFSNLINGNNDLFSCIAADNYDLSVLDIFRSDFNTGGNAKHLLLAEFAARTLTRNNRSSRGILLPSLDDASSYVSDNSKYIEVMCDRRNTLISLKEIVSVESDAHYINIGVVSGLRYRTRMTIAEFLKLADNDTRFIPVNRGIVLNADYIKDIEGSVCVTGNGERFPIKIREKTRIEQSIREYMFKKIRENQRR